MKYLAALLLLSSAAHAAEIERAPTPSPTPIVAPVPLQGSSQFQGVAPQLDAALTPNARIETSNEALANVSSMLQGGSAQTAQASVVATGNSTLLKESRVSRSDAATAKALPLAASTAEVSSPQKDVPRPSPKKDSSERALHLTAALVIVATILAYAALIKGFTSYVGDLENQVQQQIHQVEDWDR